MSGSHSYYQWETWHKSVKKLIERTNVFTQSWDQDISKPFAFIHNMAQFSNPKFLLHETNKHISKCFRLLKYSSCIQSGGFADANIYFWLCWYFVIFIIDESFDDNISFKTTSLVQILWITKKILWYPYEAIKYWNFEIYKMYPFV